MAVSIDLCGNELIKQYQPMFFVLLGLVVIKCYLSPNAGSGVNLGFLPPAFARPGRYIKTKATVIDQVQSYQEDRLASSSGLI